MYIITRVVIATFSARELRNGTEVHILNTDTGEEIIDIYKPNKEQYYKENIWGYYCNTVFTICSLSEFRLMQCLTYKDTNLVVQDIRLHVWNINLAINGFTIISDCYTINNNIGAYILYGRDRKFWEVVDNTLYVYFSCGDDIYSLEYDITQNFAKVLFMEAR